MTVTEATASSKRSHWPVFKKKLAQHGCTLAKGTVTTVQVNLGKLCNQACFHCHVDAGPNKLRENMSAATVDHLLEIIQKTATVQTVDLTGGAPELNPNFRRMVRELTARGIQVIDRCNLTVLFEPGQEGLADFLAEHQVQVVASLPCYSMENVDAQRGDGVFEKSIEGLKILNNLGYGREGSGLTLDLVYNPLGATLPPSQPELERSYKEMLYREFEIVFNRLFCITNMPIKRFLADLKRQKKYETYMELLVNSFNLGSLDYLMCKSMVSISWDGQVYDCDFNQMLQVPVLGSAKNLDQIESFDQFAKTEIALADHCYGCTAGSGSSCGGALLD